MKYILEHPVSGSIGTEKFLTTIHWRNGVLITDEPEKIGGQDLGPDPFTLLLTSLVACTLATLKMYIDHKGLSIPEMRVEANMFQKIGNEGASMQIERLIIIPGLADTELQERMIRIAESCPISKILKGNINISSEFSGIATQFPPTHTSTNSN